MQGLNTLQEAWNQSGEPLLGHPQEAAFRGAFMAGAAAVLGIAKAARPTSPAAFAAIMDGLVEEVRSYTTAASPAERHVTNSVGSGQSLRTFKIPGIGNPAEAADRIRVAIPIARRYAEQEGCAPLAAYLIEGIQHLLMGGWTEMEVEAEMQFQQPWWHAHLHLGIPAEQSARAALARGPHTAARG